MNNKLLKLVLFCGLSATYALNATRLTLKNNSNQELIIGSVTGSVMQQYTLGAQASTTLDKNVERADSYIAIYVAASPRNQSAIRFNDKNKTTYDISIVDNKIVVS